MKKDNRSPGSNCPKVPKSKLGQKKLRESKALEMSQSGELAEINISADPLEKTIFSTATSLHEFFHFNGYMILRKEWNGKTIHTALRNYLGWVYAFYDELDVPIYIGETGRTFMGRFDQHKKKQSWWPNWAAVKVLPCPDQSTRKIFESLIGLGGGYVANKMQPAGIDDIFTEVILSLKVLGNDTNTPPTFPVKVIYD